MKTSVETNKSQEEEKLFSRYKGDRSELIPLLQDVQKLMGYISCEAMQEISRFLKISEAEVFGVVSFYSQLHRTKQGKNKIKLCEGTACHVRGSKELADVISQQIGIKPGETSEDGEFSIERVACIGSCALAPAIISNDKIHGPMTPERLGTLIDDMRDNGDKASNE